MPELPEVETVRRGLAPLLVGRTLRRVVTTAASYFFLTAPDELGRRLAGRRFLSLTRHGKYLLAELDDRSTVLMHLGMTGQLFSQEAVGPRLLRTTRTGALTPEVQSDFSPDAHTHVQFEFEDQGPAVYFRDPRKFGKIAWLAPGAEEPRLAKLGPDALELTGSLLMATAKRRKTALKLTLLDQSVVAGIGNIYADEALFLAGLHPLRATASLKVQEADQLAAAVQQVLNRAIATGGSSISDYIAADGSRGQYQDERKVYARTGEACRRCGTLVQRIIVGTRGTHFCPRCQPGSRRAKRHAKKTA